MAASQIMRKDGFNDAAKVISALHQEPELGTKLKKAIPMDLDSPKPKADHLKTLAMMFQKGESVSGYESWRKSVNKTAGYALYPSYKTLAKSKVHLHPQVNKFFGCFLLKYLIKLNNLISDPSSKPWWQFCLPF